MSEQTPLQMQKSLLHNLSQSLGLRVLIIILLGLLMLIPLFLAERIVKERQNYYQNTLHSVANLWGGKQTLTGPVLIVPYVEHFTSVDTVTAENGENRVVSKDIYNDRTAILLPEKLEIRANLNEEHQQHGIYDALVYTTTISLSGKFNHSQVLQSSEGERRIVWDKAFIAIGLTDPRAIDTASTFFWNDGRIELEPGTRLSKLLPSGFHVPLSVSADSDTSNEFKLSITIRGSEGLFFSPVGENTAIRMTSAWTHPSFQGDLPPNKQEVTEAGFHAEWDIPHLVRSYPQYWVLEDQQTYDLHSISAGVNLSEPDPLYTLVNRAVKYGVLFIGLTFLMFLAFEISLKQRLHVLQYSLVGVALALFYLILLALAEHIGFLYAYIAASATTVLSITVYTGFILHSSRRAFLLLLLLTMLYALLFFLLQMEDYALLISAGLVLLATLMMMYVTRHLLSTPK